MNTPFRNAPAISGVRALLLDLDGTLVDDMYEDALAWQEAFEESGIALAVSRIHKTHRDERGALC